MMGVRPVSVFFLWATLATFFGVAIPLESAFAETHQKTWHFDRPSDYTYYSEVITLNQGGNSLAELKRLPKSTFWKAFYKDPRPLRAPEYHASAVGPDRNIIAVGSDTEILPDSLRGELIVSKYTQSGKLLPGWPKLYTDPFYQWNEGQDVLVDSKGNITVAGYTITNTWQWHMAIWRFDSNGIPLNGWPRYPIGTHAFGTGVIIDANGDIIACGSSGPTGYDYMVLAKYSQDGNPVEGWPKTYQAVDSQRNFAYDLIQDADGYLVVAGYTEDSQARRKAVLYKLDTGGNVLAGWPKVWNSSTGNYDEYFSISQDTNGDYCLVGTSQGTTKDDGRLLVTRYSKNGEQRTASGWPQIYAHNGLRDASPPDSWRGSVDTAGNIAAAGTCQSDTHVRTVKYTRKAAMAAGFPKILDRSGYQDVTRSCGVDDLDNVYVVGFSVFDDGTDTDYSTFLVKYPPAAYSTGRPAIVTKKGVKYTQLSGFTEKLGPTSQGGVHYQLSPNGTLWYYHDGKQWKQAKTKYQANPAADVNNHAPAFAQEAGTGTLYVKAFLGGNGSQQVRLDSVSIKYED
jgi:hypothetical protein